MGTLPSWHQDLYQQKSPPIHSLEHEGHPTYGVYCFRQICTTCLNTNEQSVSEIPIGMQLYSMSGKTLFNVCSADEARRRCSWELSSGTPLSVFNRAQQLSPRAILSVPAGPCPQLSDCCRSAFSQMGKRYLKSSKAEGMFPSVMLHNHFLWKGAMIFWGPFGAYWCWKVF